MVNTPAHADNRTIGLNRFAFALLAAVQVTLIAGITLVTVGLPAIQHDLRMDEHGLVLVASAYGLSFGGLLLLGGRLADLLGRRRALVAGMTVFAAASVAAGLAPAAGVLLAARFAEGAGAALAAPAALALVAEVFPDPRRRDRAIALWGVLSSAGAITGNALSGVLITWTSWRWLFLAPLLVPLITIAAARRLLPCGRVPGSPGSRPFLSSRADAPGALLSTAGLVALAYGLQHSWVTAVAGLVLLIAFGLVERRAGDPLVPPAFLRGRVRPLLATVLTSAAMAASFFLFALYLQREGGLSPLWTSAVLLLPAPALAGAGLAAGPLIQRFGTRRVLILGLVTAGAGLFALARLGVPYTGLVVFPLGAGLTFAAATVAVAGGAPTGPAGGLLNAAMEIGPPLGLTTLVALAAAHSDDIPAGYAFALRTAAVVFLITALPVRTPRRST
jgi:MFS family permease